MVSIENITVLKKAEEYLRYLGTHDVMTELYNRAFFESFCWTWRRTARIRSR